MSAFWSWSLRLSLPLLAVAPFGGLLALHVRQQALQAQLQAVSAGVAAAAQRLQALAAAPAPAAEPAAPWQLPAAADVTAVLQALEQHAGDCGCELNGLAANPGTDGERVRVQLSGRGAPMAVCALLAAIEQQPRLLLVDSGSIRGADDGRLQFELVLSAFHGGGGS